MSLNHQDFTIVDVGYGSSKSITSLAAKQNETKVVKDCEEKKVKYVGGILANAIIHARNNKKMTQKDLANRTNMKQNEVAQIETGKIVYNGEIINKINKIQRILGTKLPRP